MCCLPQALDLRSQYLSKFKLFVEVHYMGLWERYLTSRGEGVEKIFRPGYLTKNILASNQWDRYARKKMTALFGNEKGQF